MRNPGLIKTLIAGKPINAKRILRFGVDDFQVEHATAPADKSIGIADARADTRSACSVILSGIAVVEYGATVLPGDLLTADTLGRAVPASAGQRTIGIAMLAGIEGEHGSVLLHAGTA